jgi:hypothetical protein
MNPNTQDRDQQDAREIESDMRRRRGETFWDILPGELEANRKRREWPEPKQEFEMTPNGGNK